MPEHFTLEEIYKVANYLQFPTPRLWNKKRRKQRKMAESYKKRKRVKKSRIDIYV